MPELFWRRLTDWAKRKPPLLSVASRLSRGKGRGRVLDRLSRVTPAEQIELTSWSSLEIGSCWIGHATMLIRMAGLNLLTDPVFSRRIGLGLGIVTAGPKRLVGPAVTIAQLPAIDLVLLSHAHMDHLDRPSLSRLAKRFPKACVVMFDGLGDLVNDLGFGAAQELADGQSTRIGPLSISAIKTRHCGARTLTDTHRGYGSFLLEADGVRILFGGDSAFGHHWDHLSPIDLAVLGIGSYNPWIQGHANPEQVYAMACAMGARRVQPMHHSTFALSREPTDEPLRRLLACWANEKHKVGGSATPTVVATRVGDIFQMRLSDARPDLHAATSR